MNGDLEAVDSEKYPVRDDEPFDPYRAPETTDLAGDPIAMAELRILGLWERLRLLYNGLLAVEVLILTLPNASAYWSRPRFQEFLISSALGANLCFCAGPIVTAYAYWIGLRNRAVAYTLFTLGMLLSMVLTAELLAFWGFKW